MGNLVYFAVETGTGETGAAEDPIGVFEPAAEPVAEPVAAGVDRDPSGIGPFVGFTFTPSRTR
jgi:hypothetical protein